MNAVGQSSAEAKGLLAHPLQERTLLKGRWLFLRVAQSYGLAVASVMACFLVRWSLDRVLYHDLLFEFFIIPVVITGWRGGLGPSLAATALGLFIGFWFFLETRFQLASPDAVGWISLLSYLFTALLICRYSARVRVTKRRLEETEIQNAKQRQYLAEQLTEHKQAEEALRGSEQRCRAMIEAIPHQVWTARPDGACEFVSQQWQEYTGTATEEALGEQWVHQLHPEDREATKAGWAKALNAGSDWGCEFRLRRKDGSYRWFKTRAVSLRDTSDEIIQWLGTCTEITDIVEAREALQRGQGELEGLVRERTAEVEKLKSKLQEENCYLREKISLSQHHSRLVGQSPALGRVIHQVEQVAPTDSTVLLLGETGTGKELLAAMVHQLSARRDRTLVSFNCATVPPPLIESELFGREKGAFTGSLSRQIGRFELADRSTILLDEIGELPLEVQGKLLRVLEARQIERLGNPQPIAVDVRIIAATNRDLERAVREGRFREDLYYRLNVFPIPVPPLRERREDIPLLVWAFVDEFAKLFNKNIQSIEKESMDAMQRYAWPGNVRELRNFIERAMIVATSPKLRVELPTQSTPFAVNGKRKLEEVEREHIFGTLEKASWRIRGVNGAAEQLGLKPTTLEARMTKLGIHRPATKYEPLSPRSKTGYATARTRQAESRVEEPNARSSGPWQLTT